MTPELATLHDDPHDCPTLTQSEDFPLSCQCNKQPTSECAAEGCTLTKNAGFGIIWYGVARFFCSAACMSTHFRSDVMEGQ